MAGKRISVKWRVCFWTIGATIGVWLFFAYGMPLVWPVLLGYALACIVRPMVYWLEANWHLKRQVGIVILLILILGILILAAVLFIRTLLVQVLALASKSDQLLQMLSELGERVCSIVGGWFGIDPKQCELWMEEAIRQLGKIGQSLGMEQVTVHATGLVVGIGEFVVDCVLIWITAYYFARDKEKTANWRKQFLFRDEVNLVCHQLKIALVAYGKSQLVLWLLISFLSVLGLWILGNPYCVLLGILIGFLDALPFIGTGIILFPWGVISLLQGKIYLGIGLLLLFIITYFTRELLEPRLMGNGMGISSFASLLAIYVGFQVFGLLGIFYGPVAYVLILTIVKEACNLPRNGAKSNL